ncbi:hypothetical protein BDM02DRAFT_3183912 [Thelephora ganbajun]|uniref:Uncharacterized protein n=1 Tax=Thelephora ganbajun TaxID=370292 RepID=A0ACB6ZSA5_THEGA|nr:hypothetical protein BDM02DRAFT_3183912 [Thelephora ganbajun]
MSEPSSSLSPPQNRARASSTSRRPPLTLDTCSSRKRASSFSSPSSPTPTSGIPPSENKQDMTLPSLFSRTLQMLDLVRFTHPSLTPSTDGSLLPTMAPSPTFSSFTNSLKEKDSLYAARSPSAHLPLVFVIILFPLSTLLVVLCLASLPVTVSWPRTLEDLASMGKDLHSYSQSGAWPLAHVVGVLSISAVWKHAWSVPGSVAWNVLSGALFHPAWATLLLTLLTTIGSIFSSLLSRPIAPLVSQWLPRALAVTKNALHGDFDTNSTSQNKTPAWVRLSILRLIGVVPWSGLNIACGVCGVSIADCFLGTFIGALPWTAVTCQVTIQMSSHVESQILTRTSQIGDILQTVAANPSPTAQSIPSLLRSPDIIFKLILLSFLSLAPILGRDYLRGWISPRSPVDAKGETDDLEKDERRFRWVSEWRSKIRLPSKSRSRSGSESHGNFEKLS